MVHNRFAKCPQLMAIIREGRSEIILEDTYPPTATLGLLFTKGAGSITLVYPAPGHFRANSVYHASEPSPGVSS